MKNKKGIILIEDDQAIIDVYKMAMKLEGINLEVIKWGKTALEELESIQSGKREKPNLIILDLILPDISGTEIFKKIKENSKSCDIAVFILSNYTNPELENIGGISADKFILKTSITPTQLVKLVKKYIES